MQHIFINESSSHLFISQFIDLQKTLFFKSKAYVYRLIPNSAKVISSKLSHNIKLWVKIYNQLLQTPPLRSHYLPQPNGSNVKNEEETYHYTQPGAEIFNACEIDADYDLDYGNMGYQVSKEGIRKQKDQCPKINTFKENYLRIDIVPSCQKIPKSDFQIQFSMS